MRGPTAPGRPIVAMCTSRTAAGTAASALKQGCGGWCAVASDPGPWTFGCICRQIAFAHPQVSPQSHKGVRALPSLHGSINVYYISHPELLGPNYFLTTCASAPDRNAMLCQHRYGARGCCLPKDNLISIACAHALASLMAIAAAHLHAQPCAATMLRCTPCNCHPSICRGSKASVDSWLSSHDNFRSVLCSVTLQCNVCCAALLQELPIRSLWTGMTAHAGGRRVQQRPPGAHPREASPYAGARPCCTTQSPAPHCPSPHRSTACTLQPTLSLTPHSNAVFRLACPLLVPMQDSSF